jgi:hypothetical protein
MLDKYKEIYVWCGESIEPFIVTVMLMHFKASTIELMLMVVLALIASVILLPVMDCNTLLEVMLKIEYIYMALIYIWVGLAGVAEPYLSTTPKIVAFCLFVATCCEAVAGLIILIILRNVGDDLFDTLYWNYKLSLRG